MYVNSCSHCLVRMLVLENILKSLTRLHTVVSKSTCGSDSKALNFLRFIRTRKLLEYNFSNIPNFSYLWLFHIECSVQRKQPPVGHVVDSTKTQPLAEENQICVLNVLRFCSCTRVCMVSGLFKLTDQKCYVIYFPITAMKCKTETVHKRFEIVKI